MEIDKSFRELFNGIEVPVLNNAGESIVPINFDNAATTPPLKKVDEFVFDNILMYGSVGRGGQKSSYCTAAYEISREQILDFFGLSSLDGYEVIYVKNTTEGINLLAHILCDRNKCKVLTTRMEHHANDLPWRQVGYPYYCEVDEGGRLKLEELEERLSQAMGTINLVSVTAVSNVTGFINPIHDIARMVHRYGARLIVDGAQLVAHREINLKGNNEEEAIDFIVFSGHKMYAPFGSGVIVGRKTYFEDRTPFLSGGGTVAVVLDDDVYYKATPYKDEAGTPNFLGAMSIVAAMSVLKQVGFEQIKAHEKQLMKRVLEGLGQLPEVTVYGGKEVKQRVGVISFNVNNKSCSQMGELLQERRAIAVRTGCFCAQPYVMRLLGMTQKERYENAYNFLNYQKPMPGMVRASFGLYNTLDEVDEFLNVVEAIAKES